MEPQLSGDDLREAALGVLQTEKTWLTIHEIARQLGLPPTFETHHALGRKLGSFYRYGGPVERQRTHWPNVYWEYKAAQ
jgi:hypothetical protein